MHKGTTKQGLAALDPMTARCRLLLGRPLDPMTAGCRLLLGAASGSRDGGRADGCQEGCFESRDMEGGGSVET
jgi:hypothetical protein